MRIMKAPNFGPDDPVYWDYVQFPLYASIKYDGIRCHVEDGVCLSTTNKPIPNIHIQAALSQYESFDGELVCGEPNAPNAYNRTQSMVMSQEHEDDFTFYVFDLCSEATKAMTFETRQNILIDEVIAAKDPRVKSVEHALVLDQDELERFEDKILSQGYEGLMLNMPTGRYKPGRATAREQIIYKLKRFTDAEGVLVDMLEAEENLNESFENELGLLKKRDTKDAKAGMGQVGTFIVDFDGDYIKVGPGKFTHEQRQKIWRNSESYLGRYLKFKYLNIGIKDKPRHPVALGFRDVRDL